jgi:hypothetical protein
MSDRTIPLLVARLINLIGFCNIEIEHKDISDYSPSKLETATEGNSATEAQSDVLLEEQRKFMRQG